MMKPLGLALLAAGVVLLILGINASESVSSDISRFFHGTPTDRSVWFLVGGAAAIVAGAVMALVPRRERY